MTENKNFISKLIAIISDKISGLKDPQKRLRFVLLGGAALLTGLFAFTLFLPTTSSPESCMIACHSQNREFFTWKKSSHSNITCTACHVNQGLLPLFHEKTIEALPALYGEIFGHKTPINIESEVAKEDIPNQRCERCHNMITRDVTPSRIYNEKMNGKGKDKYHNKHLKKGIPCTLCHNRVAHKDVNEPEILKEAGYSKDNEYDKEVMDKEYEDGLSMTEGCFRCHSPSEEKRDHELVEKYRADDAPKECITCHEKDILPIGHKNNDWRTQHPDFAKKDFNYCFKCHGEKARFNFEDKKYCTRCHAESLVDSWK